MNVFGLLERGGIGVTVVDGIKISAALIERTLTTGLNFVLGAIQQCSWN